MKRLKKAYKRLDIEKYKGVIKNTLIPFLDTYEGNYLATLRPDSIFTIQKHFYNGIFMGWNIYADGILLETKSTRKKARKYIKQLSNYF